MRLDIAGRVASLGAFGVIYSVLLILGLVLRESSQQLTIIWPAAGLLFIALWFAPRRNWIWILGVQVAAEIVIDAARSGHFLWLHYGPSSRQFDRRYRRRVHCRSTHGDSGNSADSACLAFLGAVALGAARAR